MPARDAPEIQPKKRSKTGRSPIPDGQPYQVRRVRLAASCILDVNSAMGITRPCAQVPDTVPDIDAPESLPKKRVKSGRSPTDLAVMTRGVREVQSAPDYDVRLSESPDGNASAGDPTFEPRAGKAAKVWHTAVNTVWWLLLVGLMYGSRTGLYCLWPELGCWCPTCCCCDAVMQSEDPDV